MNKQPSILEQLFSLQGKTALVTGASGGIGQALALALARAGATVAVHGQRADVLDEARQSIENGGGRAVTLLADLGEVEACRRLIADAHAGLGRLDVLVNCAGINRRAPLASAREQDFDAIVAVNLRSVLVLSQAAHAMMRDQGGGKIVNIGSVTSTTGVGGVGVYGATKAALAQLTKTMAVEWARDNIQVNCLAPGFIKTPLTEEALWGDATRREWLLDRIPARRPGQPDDLLGALLLMASPASDYLTGQTLTVDGGYLAGGWWQPADE